MNDYSGHLARQADITRALGSPFVAAVLEAGHRQLGHAPRTAALIDSWPGDVAAAALAMRFNAALHALARSGAVPALHDLYQRRHDDFDGAVGAAMAASDGFIATWMRDPPQTNEVGRAAAIMAALMVVADAHGLPFDLLELGSSAGLNLNLAHYAYRLGTLATGKHGSQVHIAPEWRGPPPPDAAVTIATARGVDLHPLDVGEAATRERLLSYVFADQPARADRLCAAIALARDHPPRIDRADAATWLVDRLAEPQPAGRCRVVFHSMVLQYLDAADRRTVTAAIAAAGQRADVDRPFAHIALEWTEARDAVQVWLTCWPDGEPRHLANCHPYGAWIDWMPARSRIGSAGISSVPTACCPNRA